MKSPSLYSILLLSVSVSRVGASPTGASGCPAGESAAGGPHANRSPGNLGALSGGNFTLSINGDEISDSMELSTGSEYTLSLSGAEFRGFLFRLESSGVNASSYLTPGTVGGSQPTAIGICPDDVGSVTHSMNDAKMEATAILNIGNPGMYSMDVTVVTRTCAPDSKFVEPCDPAVSVVHYSGYVLNVTGESTVPTSSGVVKQSSLGALFLCTIGLVLAFVMT